ncbi:MAG: MDR family MFS transporter [Spirochaetaceae bacterium]
MKSARYLRELYGGLPREIYALFVAQAINSLGHFVYPFLTLLLTQQGGYTASEAGRYILLASSSFIPGSLLGGRISDRFGRKRLLVTAMSAGAVIFIVPGYLERPEALPWFMMAAEFCMGMVDPTITALATDVTIPENRKSAFSLLYLGHNLGFVAGPIIAGYLFTRNYNLLFFGDAATTLVAVILIALLVGESRPEESEIRAIGEQRPMEAKDLGSGLRVILRRPALLVFMVGVLLIEFVYAQFTFTLPLHLQELFGDRGAGFFGTIMTINALVVVLATAPLIAVTRKMRPVATVAMGTALYILGFGLLFFTGRFYFVILMSIIWTFGEILTATNIDVFIANHTPASHRGRVNAIAPILFGLGYAISPALMGSYIDRFSPARAWPLVASVAAVATAVLTLLALQESRHPKGPSPTSFDASGIPEGRPTNQVNDPAMTVCAPPRGR